MEIPTSEFVRSLPDAADPRCRAFIRLCTFAGLRLSETAALQVGGTDFLRRQVHVRR